MKVKTLWCKKKIAELEGVLWVLQAFPGRCSDDERGQHGGTRVCGGAEV